MTFRARSCEHGVPLYKALNPVHTAGRVARGDHGVVPPLTHPVLGSSLGSCAERGRISSPRAVPMVTGFMRPATCDLSALSDADRYVGCLHVCRPNAALIRRIGPPSPTRTSSRAQWGRGTLIAPLNWVARLHEDDPTPSRSQAWKITMRSPFATLGYLPHLDGS
jgi:hypothetical protein